MSVKDLVGLYDARSSSSLSQSPQNRPGSSRSTPRPSVPNRANAEPTTSRQTRPSAPLPPPSPARFLRHSPSRHGSPLSTDNVSPAIPGLPIATTLDDNSHESELQRGSNDDLTDEATLVSEDGEVDVSEVAATSRMKKWLAGTNHDQKVEGQYAERHSLLSKRSGFRRDSYPTGPSPEDYMLSPFDSKEGQFASLTSTLMENRSGDAPSSIGRLRPLAPHTPVPASTVFARNAAPLYLPKLDDYLSTLPAPKFTPILPHPQAKTQVASMFPPFDILAASGKTIDDLEKNSQIAPTWRNRDSILSGLVSIVLGITGSSAVATFYSLQGLMNTLQIFALILNTIVPRAGLNISATWKNLFLGKIPNILALNFASTMTESIVYLLIFMAVACILLYLFHRATAESAQISVIEGLQRPTKPSSGWGIVIVSFLLTVIYLPLSTMAVHVLVWSQDLWAVPNPYINATTSPPQVVPLGPSDEYRDPLDFCWATTMKRNEVNWAPALFIIAAIIVGLLTVWFPIRLRQLIKQSVPIVDPYTELGRLRTKPDMDREYSRLLARDTNPFSFLYSGFRRGWATYEAVYLFAKFSTLLVVAVVDPNNCLFRTLSSTKVTIARQFLLVIVASFFFVLQCFLGPFLDPINNASEWTSRLNYVLTAAVALGVAYNIPGSSILDGVILYIIYGVTYGLSVYFLIINMSIMHRTVKRLARRIDFSIDIFSPRIDLSHSSPHTKRRIWQETISALFLTSPECRIPKKQPMYFVQARDSEYPPYLMDFCGTPAERHVENLKILREVGSADYLEAVALVSGLEHEWFRHLEKEIQERFVGPDCYWKSPHERSIPGCTKYFGNAWWIPFPPTLVLRYDDGPLAVIRSVEDLEAYVVQNSSVQIRRRREVRMALRALDGQRVLWPYKLTQSVGAHHSCCRGRRYNARTTTYYQTGVLQIKHHGHLVWESTQLGSGFDVQLEYAKTANVDGGVFGLNDDYDLTAPLARFLALNHELIPQRLAHLEGVLFRYRQHHRRECLTKSRVLTYRFLTRVYDRPREPSGLAETSIEFESDLRVRQLMVGNEDVFRSSFERMSYVSTSEMATWWFLFWDDLWRRNHDTISALPLYASDFNPYYPTSIAYTPLPRPALEAFLTQRGMLHKPSKWGDFFHSGFLNRMYLRMNEVAFKGSSRVIWLHLGHNVSELDMEDVDIQTQARSSTLGTGGGTDHDDASIRPRPTFRWEGILADPIRQGKRHRNLFAKFEAWFGLTPLWRSGTPSNGVSLDVVLENGRYLVLNPDGSTSLSGSDLKV